MCYFDEGGPLVLGGNKPTLPPPLGKQALPPSGTPQIARSNQALTKLRPALPKRSPPSPLTMLLSRHTRRREFIAGLGGAAAAAALFGLDNLRRKRLAVRSLRKVTTGAP
jgi:hypothetical protein